MEVKNCAYVTYNTKNFEHKLFGGMYVLAMMMFISTRTASKKIDKITLSLKNINFVIIILVQMHFCINLRS